MKSQSETKEDTQKMPLMRRKITGIIAVLALLLAAWFLFAPEAIPVETATVVRGPMQVTVNNQGQVRAHDRYLIAAPVAAELKRIELREGDQVRKNQIVAYLNPLPMDARQREEARARLNAAKALAREAGLNTQAAYTAMQFAISERVRTERLISSGYVSSQAMDKALTAERTSRADWTAAKSREQAALADVKAAEAALISVDMPSNGSGPELQLVSPVDGYVLRIQEPSARTISAGTSIMTIGDPTRYELVVDVLSTDAVKITPGALMYLEEWGGDKALRAKVRKVEPVAFTKISALGVEEQRVNVIADPIDALGPLGDGYRIEARIVIWASDKVMKVAGSSLFRVGDAWHIFVIEEGRARERTVKVGHRNQDEAQILSGLAVNTQVIRYPNNQLEDGMRVVPLARSGP